MQFEENLGLPDLLGSGCASSQICEPKEFAV
jgi:hypothetical protein